jgi:hypothetical protein
VAAAGRERKRSELSIISSSSSEIWFSAPRALCSANLLLNTSRATVSPVEDRKSENLRESLGKGTLGEAPKMTRGEAHSGRMREVRKSLERASSGVLSPCSERESDANDRVKEGA